MRTARCAVGSPVSGLGFPPEATYGSRVTALSVLFMYLPAVAVVLTRPNDTTPATASRTLTRIDLLLAALFAVSAFFAIWGTTAKYR